MRATLRISAVLAVVLLGACRSPSLEIESTTSWSGTYKVEGGPNVPVSGTGNASFEMDSNNFCWTIQKTTDLGRLRVFAKVPNWITTDHGGIRDTFEPFGAASSCSYE